MALDLAKDYAAYLDATGDPELNGLTYTIEEMLTRLDEFETLAGMVKNEMNSCLHDALSKKLVSYKPQLEELCSRVDLLDQMVTRVSEDLEILDETVEKAKSEVSSQPTGRLKSLIKPFLFKGTPDPAKTSRPTPTLDSHTFFTADEFFPQPPDEPST